MPICQNCDKEFPNKIVVDDETISLASRKFCLECSPLGSRNTRSYIIELKENEAYCARCQKIKDKKEFYSRKNGKPLSYCICCQEEVKDLKLQENIERMVLERGGICEDCNYSYPLEIYEFYCDGDIFNLNKARGISFEKLQEKLIKYIMLCKNCSALRSWAKH